MKEKKRVTMDDMLNESLLRVERITKTIFQRIISENWKDYKENISKNKC